MKRPPLATVLMLAASYLPSRSPRGIARKLLLRANAERDALRFQTASALYEEVLKLVPREPRFHVQCGHSHKEAGNLAKAEHHYLAALALLPDDPDLSLQLGHFYKVSSRPDEAERWYRRAVEQRPGWNEPKRELAQIDGAVDAAAPAATDGEIVPDLLPGEPEAAPVHRPGFHVRQLGAGPAWAHGGFRRVLGGVEAIRGFLISDERQRELRLLVDGREVQREPLAATGPTAGQFKHAFNIWHDFSDIAPGQRQLELCCVESGGRRRSYRAMIEVVAPRAVDDFPASDAVIDPPAGAPGTIEQWVASRPSMCRDAARTALPAEVRSVLVLRVDQLGDLACSVPALQRLRAMFPRARLVALVSPANVDLARAMPMLDEVIVADFREQVADGRRSLSGPEQVALRRRLATYCFDLAIDLGETATSRPLLLLSGARFLYGFKDREFPWLSAGCDLHGHDPVNRREVIPTANKLVAMVDALAATLGGAGQPLRRPGLDPAGLRELGLEPGEPYIMLHTGARLPHTCWPHFAALAAMLLARTTCRVVVMSDRPFAGLRGDPRLLAITGRLPFDLFDGLLSGAALFIGNDSGPKHLAALRGVKVISLHMARLNWNEWGQQGRGAVISRRVPCAGCGIGGEADECGKGFACIRDIRAEEVADVAVKLLEAA